MQSLIELFLIASGIIFLVYGGYQAFFVKDIAVGALYIALSACAMIVLHQAEHRGGRS